MTPLRLFWLYRAPAPSVRAQSIQVVHSAHAMASRGHQVTLAVQPPSGRPSAADVLDFYGLRPTPTLRLHVLPTGNTAASLAHRALFLAWAVRGGVVIARSKRYADQALRVAGRRITLILEVHEVDSAQAEERGEDPGPLRTLERRVLEGAAAVVANAPGTLALLRETHGSLPPAIALHNATHPSRIRAPSSSGEGIGYVGSYIPGKDLETLAAAAARLPMPVHLVGATGAEALQALAGGRLVLEPPLPHREVPDRLARFRVLALPLAPGLFGERLTSPLKLWDYLASGVPVVGADTRALQEAAGGAFLPYQPGDIGDLASALARMHDDEGLRARVRAASSVRTWDQRAAELEDFLQTARIAP